MKIAIMMRAMDQDSGFRTIMEGLVESILRIDTVNSYLLFYRKKKWFGRFSTFRDVTEILLTAPHKLLWDQVAVPYRAWKEKADIIYNPKFSIPIFSHCPVVMGLHEPVWWAWPEHYEWLDRKYMRIMLPIYCRKATHMFPISNFALNENKKYLKLPFDNTTISYPAPKEYFLKISDKRKLENFQKKYSLPDKFILCVTRVDHPGLENSESFFPGKNPETALKAFIAIRDEIPHKLVFAGRRVKEYFRHIGFTETDLTNVLFPDFIPHEEINMLYSLAELFVLPSYYESFAMNLVEAMASGCPVVASKTGACSEIGDNAVLLADPYDHVDFSAKIIQVLKDKNLMKEMSKKSLARASYFNWERTAKINIDIFTRICAVH